MVNNPYRLLGCAFASADLLIELDGEGCITFAIGAAGRIANVDAADLTGMSWRQLVAEEDHPLVEFVLAGLAEGGRRGPVNIELIPGPGGERRVATFSACKLPQLAPHFSCAISMGAVAHALIERQGGSGPNKLHDAESFGALAKGMWDVARGTGLEIDLCLVEVKGLQEVVDAHPENAEKALRDIAGVVRAGSYGGVSAACLAPERYALLREQGARSEYLLEQLKAVATGALGAGESLALDATAIAFAPLDAQPEQIFRALRFALDKFIGQGLASKPAASLGEVFQDLVTDTMNRAGAFKAIVEERKFQLAFQPVVSLADGSIHHHEVLARFAEGESPFSIIRLAEELDLIERFDLAMVEAVLARMTERSNAGLHLAVNISGQSLMSPTFVEGLTRLLDGRSDFAKRMMFEVTESAALTDLSCADRHIQTLRKMGFRLCLDDFGAGAASFPYLKMLTVDAVKIDGQYVREITQSERDDDLVRHLVELCRSLNVKTVAEMVETEDVAHRLKALGVDFGQGWLYGRPQSEPAREPKSFFNRVLFRGKRKGTTAGWG